MSKITSSHNPATHPPGIPFIIGNEAAERFSYYGMKTILVVFMTTLLASREGALAPMSETEASGWFHVFGMANYFFPIFGALLSDILWGKYKTIIVLSLVYCLGHLALSLDDTRMGLAIGLGLIAVGAGGIKPCVSAHLGDQFSKTNAHLLGRMFGYFYIAVNVGAAASSLLTPWLLARFGPWVAFGVPGLLMLLSTVLFWMGRAHFIAVPPVGWSVFRTELFKADGRIAFRKLLTVFLFVAIFWSLFDQTGSSWVFQAEHMDKNVSFFGVEFELYASQVQAVNPLLILILVPLCSYLLYPLLAKFGIRSSLHKIHLGLFLTTASFGIIAYAQYLLDIGERVSILWQCSAYFLLTLAEILVSITFLEYCYTQAPSSLKSILMSFYLLAVSLGNGITALVNFLIIKPDGSALLTGSSYFVFFTLLMFLATIAFGMFTRGQKEELYVREHLI